MQPFCAFLHDENTTSCGCKLPVHNILYLNSYQVHFLRGANALNLRGCLGTPLIYKAQRKLTLCFKRFCPERVCLKRQSLRVFSPIPTHRKITTVPSESDAPPVSSTLAPSPWMYLQDLGNKGFKPDKLKRTQPCNRESTNSCGIPSGADRWRASASPCSATPHP